MLSLPTCAVSEWDVHAQHRDSCCMWMQVCICLWDKSEEGTPSPALVHQHHLAVLPRTPVAPTLQEQEVLLCIYFKAAGLSLHLRRRDRGRVTCIRNSSLVGPCEYISLTNIGGVWKGLLFYEAFPGIEGVFWHQSMSLYYAFKRGGEKKFTSIRAERVAFECRPNSWYSVS